MGNIKVGNLILFTCLTSILVRAGFTKLLASFFFSDENCFIEKK